MSALNYQYLLSKFGEGYTGAKNGSAHLYLNMDSEYNMLESRLDLILDYTSYEKQLHDVASEINKIIDILIKKNTTLLATDELNELRLYADMLKSEELSREFVDEVLLYIVETLRKYNDN